jgi:hypothetical protein
MFSQKKQKRERQNQLKSVIKNNSIKNTLFFKISLVRLFIVNDIFFLLTTPYSRRGSGSRSSRRSPISRLSW